MLAVSGLANRSGCHYHPLFFHFNHHVRSTIIFSRFRTPLTQTRSTSRDASFAEANYTQTSDPDIQILESDFVDLENDYYALKNANFDLHEEVQRLTKANDDLETLVDQRSKEKSTLETQQTLLQGQLDQAKDEVCDLKIQMQEVENEKNGFQATCLGLKDVKQKLRNVLEEKLKISERMVQLQEEKTKLEQRADLNNQKVEKFSDLHVDLLDSKSKLNEELANLRATSAQESDEYKRVISELQAANEDMKVKIERCDQDLSYSEDRIQGLEAEVEKLKQQSLDQREKHHNEILIREIRWATVEQMVQGLQRENWNLKNAAKSQSMGQEIEAANKRILELEQLSSSLQETHARRLTQETSATQAKLEDLQKTEESQAQFQERYKAVSPLGKVESRNSKPSTTSSSRQTSNRKKSFKRSASWSKTSKMSQGRHEA
ncbi:hypothetical protein L596_025734 [Steinernema carpocapsae]|uniref:Uncharacterized protein n=1 Tax=Steinernema carpocapsae TaxID=34508 RepID=A0A4V5ZYX7_STECR|nr:hypothetical protein L596_025734 [Steinernema carpocapsae]